MKILNITASMLAFVLLSGPSYASGSLNDEFGETASAATTATTGSTATIAPVVVDATGPTPSVTLLSRLLWLPVKAVKSFGLGIVVGGAAAYNGVHETYLAVSNKGTHPGDVLVEGKYPDVLDNNSQRWSRFKLGLFGVFPGSIAGLFLVTGLSFWNSDEYGNIDVPSIHPGGPAQPDQPSPARKALGSFLNLLTLPGKIFNR